MQECYFPLYLHPLNKEPDAQVAKLVDALCSGRSARKGVLVRIQSWAQTPFQKIWEGVFHW